MGCIVQGQGLSGIYQYVRANNMAGINIAWNQIGTTFGAMINQPAIYTFDQVW